MKSWINSVKHTVHMMELNGKWNDSINYLYDLSVRYPDNVKISCLFIAQCFWLIYERGFLESNEKARPKGFFDIEWNFENKMQEKFLQGLERFHDESFFQWYIGYLLNLGEYCFPPVIAFESMFERACTLKPDGAIENAIAGKVKWMDEIEDTFKKRLLAEIRSMDIQWNYIDAKLWYMFARKNTLKDDLEMRDYLELGEVDYL